MNVTVASLVIPTVALGGATVVTIAFNVPLNTALAEADTTSPESLSL